MQCSLRYQVTEINRRSLTSVREGTKGTVDRRKRSLEPGEDIHYRDEKECNDYFS
jgi:hypothetical protein